ncbi:hypothetical protein BDR04DRAFT_1184569 [Suillus decipiens]|nr:hypothetical protein BDR04DRAFT_1184569 [Suillus decipiens]
MTDTTPLKAFKVVKPADFDGSKDAFVAWFRHVLIYFESQDTVVPTSKQKIIFTMSYMKTGFAGEWAALAYDREKAKSLSTRWDWDVFVKELKGAFSPINEIRDAQERLSTFMQGKMPIEEFLTCWMQILVTAEYTNIKPNSATADHLINILHTNLMKNQAGSLNDINLNRVWELTEKLPIPIIIFLLTELQHLSRILLRHPQETVLIVVESLMEVEDSPWTLVVSVLARTIFAIAVAKLVI